VNTILIEKNDLNSEQIVTLTGRQAEHIKAVIKPQIHDEVKVTVVNHGLSKAKIVDIQESEVSIKVEDDLKEGLSYPISLIVGASRPQTMKKVIEHGTSLGVNEFQILNAKLSEKSYLQSKIYQDKEFKELTQLGLEQSTVFYQQPKVHKAYNLQALNFQNIDQRYILSPYTDCTINEIDLDISRASVFAIGPERGWSNEELNFFTENNFKELKISPSILRVEIATLSLLGLLNQKMIL
jgi:16S rRNA (uracil1498-N3)-methyltransferase